MKKKLTVNTIALGNLKQRKKQYTIMIIGIVLAMVFSSSILFFMFSAAETYKVNSYKEIGCQDSIIYVNGFTEQDYKDCVNDGIISDYSFAHTIGYAYTADDEAHLGASVAWLDDKAKELSYQIFLQGSYPQNENEIAIEQTVLTKLGYTDAELGDTITLKLRVQSNNDYLDPVEKEYKLVGIVSDKKQQIGYFYSDGTIDTLVPALFVAQNTQTELGGKEKLVAYVSIDEKNSFYKEYIKSKAAQGEYYDASSVMYEYFSEKTDDFDLNPVSVSDNLNLTAYSSISSNSEYIVIIAIVLVFASCVAIVNSFNTNLKERRKQIGMLRAVGTTRRQIINIFGREAFIISLIAAPVSIVISFFIVKFLLSILSDDAVMTKSIAVLPAAVIINICVVMIAALLPLIAASRITPMQAIRNINNNRRVKTKKIKSKAAFNAPSHIAKRNLTFYKGGRAAVSIMLIATIVFSCFGFSFMSYSKDNQYIYEHDYNLDSMNGDGLYDEYYNMSESKSGLSESERNEIESKGYVSKTYGSKTVNAVIHTDTLNNYIKSIWYDGLYFSHDDNITYDDLKEQMNSDPEDYYYDAKKLLGISDEMFSAQVIAYDDKQLSVLENCLVDGEIDYEKIASGEEIILVAPQKVQYKAKISSNGYYSRVLYDEDIETYKNLYTVISEGECPYKVGDTIDLTIAYCDTESEETDIVSIVDEKKEKQVKIGAIVSPNDTNGTNGFYIYNMAVLTSIQGMNSFAENVKYDSLNIDVDEEIDEAMDADIMEYLEHYADKYGGYASSNYQNIQWQEKEYNSLYTAMLALIIIGFVICASIINNSISAGIRENKRVIGTLRAVGAAEADLVKSYLFQMRSMFTWGVAIGYGGFIIAYLIMKAAVKYIPGYTMEFYFSPWATIAMTVVLFAVCAVNVWSKIRKEIKNSIVENIREL